MEDFRLNDGVFEFSPSGKLQYYENLKEKYGESYEKALKKREIGYSTGSFMKKCIKMIQSGLFWSPLMTFLTKLLFLSSLLGVFMYCILLFSHVVFGI